MIPEGWQWNQAELGLRHDLNSVLVSLIALRPNGSPYPVGTGFIVSAQGGTAIACTAAHVLNAATERQRGPRRHHPSTPVEFREPDPLLSLAPGALRALHVVGQRAEMAKVSWAVFDEKADVAFLALEPQNGAGFHAFEREVLFAQAPVHIGDEVAILGYAGMEVREESVDQNGDRSFQIARELVLRIGRVSAEHADGHILVRGDCFESTIPVSDGMSGSPVMRWQGPEAPPEVVGLVSSDEEREDPALLDRRIPGRSIAARLSPSVSADGRDFRVRLTLKNGVLVEAPTAT